MYYLKKYHHQPSITIGYARVSSADQRQALGLAVQRDALSFCDLIFVEKDSGANNHHPQLDKALETNHCLRHGVHGLCPQYE